MFTTNNFLFQDDNTLNFRRFRFHPFNRTVGTIYRRTVTHEGAYASRRFLAILGTQHRRVFTSLIFTVRRPSGVTFVTRLRNNY